MIYSESRGKGLPVVFLHGFGEDHTLWDNLADSLSKSFEVIALDLPGFGKSERLAGKFTIDEVAEKVYVHLTEELNLSQFSIFGHSLGGYVALSLADNHSESILGIGLINSTALEDSPEKKENRDKTAQFIRKHGATFFLKSFVPNLFAEDNRLKMQDEIDFVITMGENVNADVLAEYMLAMKDRPDRSHLLEKFEQFLFVGGENDAGFTHEDYQFQISRLKNKQTAQIMPNVGHMSMYEAPTEFSTIINSFLKSV